MMTNLTTAEKYKLEVEYATHSQENPKPWRSPITINLGGSRMVRIFDDGQVYISCYRPRNYPAIYKCKGLTEV